MNNNYQKVKYTPNLFLKALGNGGLSVTFFMYLMFLIPHKTPMPIFSDVFGNIGNDLLPTLLILINSFLILFFASRYFYHLIKELKHFIQFKKTKAYKALLGTNHEITLMAVPLTLGMGVNVLFILGLVFVPNLWSIVEYLFPIAIILYLMIGYYASKLFIHYFYNTLAQGNFDYVKNNNLSQMIAPFAFIMVSVGLAAPAAMSHTQLTSLVAFTASILFLVLTILLIGVKLILGFKSIFEYGVDHTSSPTLWIVIPITTLIGITLVRLISGIAHNFLNQEINPIIWLIVLTTLISVQVIFGFLGYYLMKRHGYFRTFISGKDYHIGSYALICPGVATFVLAMFYVHMGLLKTGLMTKFAWPHLLILIPLVLIQVKTIFTLFKLDAKHSKVEIVIE